MGEAGRYPPLDSISGRCRRLERASAQAPSLIQTSVDHLATAASFIGEHFASSMPPRKIKLVSEAGLEVSGLIGPYHVGATLILQCHVDGVWRFKGGAAALPGAFLGGSSQSGPSNPLRIVYFPSLPASLTHNSYFGLRGSRHASGRPSGRHCIAPPRTCTPRLVQLVASLNNLMNGSHGARAAPPTHSPTFVLTLPHSRPPEVPGQEGPPITLRRVVERLSAAGPGHGGAAARRQPQQPVLAGTHPRGSVPRSYLQNLQLQPVGASCCCCDRRHEL
ncbi:hypothetical protein GWK47_013175 [Chionoecetes opilio]|uniref:Uncharacterized protein n=1 Tax=Chionoecetes opilio TaxID=41210 RepID=A0A8J4XWT2_CHIOP|nr:hypothetical protein GWK47_013175 [Chionoecetes opilio]